MGRARTRSTRPQCVDVACSAGTYVRALARDLGAAVGSAGYLGALRRTASGPFTLADAHPLDEVRAAAAEERLGRACSCPSAAGLDDLPAVTLADAELRVVAHGGWIGRVERLGRGGGGDRGRRAVRLLAPTGTLAAIARSQPDGRLVTDKVLLGPRDGGAVPDDGGAAATAPTPTPGTAPDPEAIDA